MQWDCTYSPCNVGGWTGMMKFRDIKIRYMFRGQVCILPLPDVDKPVEGVLDSLLAASRGDITLAECRLEGVVELQGPFPCHNTAEDVTPEGCIHFSGCSPKRVAYSDSLLTIVMWIDFNATVRVSFDRQRDMLGLRGEVAIALKARVYVSPPLRRIEMLNPYLTHQVQLTKAITWNDVLQRDPRLWLCRWYVDRRFCDFAWGIYLAELSWMTCVLAWVGLGVFAQCGILDTIWIIFVVLLCKQFPALSTTRIVRWSVIVLKWDIWFAALSFSVAATLALVSAIAFVGMSLAPSPPPLLDPSPAPVPDKTTTATTTVLTNELSVETAGLALVVVLAMAQRAPALALLR